VFAAAVEKGYLWLVIVAMVNATISLYYYIMVVKAAYLLEPEGTPARLQVSVPTRVLAGVLVTIMVAAGIFPHQILQGGSGRPLLDVNEVGLWYF
jgi:NADH-quinone oxidoreductase subunit N